jgi:hypothetical protein
MTPSKKPERDCDSMEVTLFNRGWNAAIDATTPPAAPVQPAPEQQQPVAVVEIAVSPRRSIVVTHIPGTPFPRVGDFVYIKPERGTPT